MPTPEEIAQAIQVRDWYGLIVLICVLITWILKTAPGVWEHIPRRYQWAPPVVIGILTGVIDAAHSGAGFTLAIVQGVCAGLQIGLAAVGVHHTIKRVGNAPAS